MTQSLQRRAEVESMKGDLAETKRFLTADKDSTADLAESSDSMSLTLEERQKSSVGHLARHVLVTTLLSRGVRRYAWCTWSWQFQFRRSRSRLSLGKVYISPRSSPRSMRDNKRQPDRTRNHSSKRKEQPQAQPLPSQHKKKKTRIPSNAKQRDKRTGTRTSTCKKLQRYRRSAARNIYTGHLGTRRPRQPWMRPKPANLVQALTANMLAHHLCVVC